MSANFAFMNGIVIPPAWSWDLKHLFTHLSCILQFCVCPPCVPCLSVFARRCCVSEGRLRYSCIFPAVLAGRVLLNQYLVCHTAPEIPCGVWPILWPYSKSAFRTALRFALIPFSLPCPLRSIWLCLSTPLATRLWQYGWLSRLRKSPAGCILYTINLPSG